MSKLERWQKESFVNELKYYLKQEEMYCFDPFEDSVFLAYIIELIEKDLQEESNCLLK